MAELSSRQTPEQVLASLKDFQRDTVEHVYRRLFTDSDPVRRFLIADEVGLGKTLVARGVAACAVEQLAKEGIERIDVVYICSNQDIARQNVNRLNIGGEDNLALASRITLMPRDVRNLTQNRLNFISITPGTSLDPKSRLGSAEERAMLFLLLRELWGFQSEPAATKVLRGLATLGGFQDRVAQMRATQLDHHLTARFNEALIAHDEALSDRRLRERFENLCDEFRWHRHATEPSAGQSEERSQVVSELRRVLATTCIEALEPDLIILDEFQRFRSLLDGEDVAGQLAQELFNYEDHAGGRARVLLLSATPYKMYTLSDDASGDDHYRDFIRTLRFLYQDGRAEEVEDLLKRYRRTLYRSGRAELDELGGIKRALESRLKEVMVRTERLAATPDRNGMLVTREPTEVRLKPDDVDAYSGLQSIAELLGEPDVLEYWKSGSYLLNFMDSYKFKQRFRDSLRTPVRGARLSELLDEHTSLLLNRSNLERYEQVDPGNPRLRALVSDVIDSGVWQALWIAPSLPYYELEEPFASQNVFTKRLVFSSWQVVPKVVAALVSYFAERQMELSFDPRAANTTRAREARGRLLDFSRSQGRLTGMPVIALMYPSTTLARAVDPLRAALTLGPRPMEEAVSGARETIEGLLTDLAQGRSDGPEDEAWYWAAPIMLDLLYEEETTREWFSATDLPTVWAGGERLEARGAGGWADHVARAQELVAGRVELGRRPADLPQVLTDLALAGPAVTALRALAPVTGGISAIADSDVRDSAGQIAWAMRSLLNLPEVTALIRSLTEGRAYWHQVLRYSVRGCLQAVLDEYVHVLVEALGLIDKDPSERAEELAEEISRALTLRTATFGVDYFETSNGSVSVEADTTRARFAARFGNERSLDSTEPTRADQVRAAFNSPFWPFVLASTSVGQEGLDFHQYCHAVVHWNLPANPVDLEQREGRVHRYKGHAVRRNLARRYGMRSLGRDTADPWARLFERAVADRKPSENDLVPFWVYATDGGAAIERHVPAVPFSRDTHRLEALRRSLAVYRLAFGQSRQEDLLTYLLSAFPEAELGRLADRLRVDLSPPTVQDQSRA